MERDPLHDWAAGLAAADAALEALEQAMAGRLELEAPRVLKLGRGRAVFAARHEGRPVIVKRFEGDGAADQVRRLQAELSLLQGHMAEGPYRMMACLRALPEAGIAVLSQVPGRPVSEAMANSDTAGRAALVTAAVGWLNHYSGTRRRAGTLGPRHWIRRCAALPLDELPAPTRALAQDLLRALRDEAPRLRGTPVIQAAVHGDFVPFNIFAQGAPGADLTLWGIDVQGEAWMALARDAARFLNWTQTHCWPEAPAPAHHGLAPDLWQAFTAARLLPEAEHGTALRFFLGEMALTRLAETPGHEGRQAAARAWLAGPCGS